MNARELANKVQGVITAVNANAKRAALTALTDVAQTLEQEAKDREERDKKYDALQEIGKNAATCLSEMVAALECDYDRLEELRDERRALADEIGTHGQTHKQRESAEATLAEWDEENGEELKELEAAAGECKSREDAETRIHEDPLSLEVTFGSCAPGEAPEPEGFVILLGTGGPAVRVVGELDANNEPGRAWIEVQDWWQPWTEYHGDAISRDDLLTYCRCFYFGE